MNSFFKIFISSVLAACVFTSLAAQTCIADESEEITIKVLIVTGQDHPAHDWAKTAPVLKEVLEKDSRLRVKVVEEPNFLSQPQVHNYDVIVLHFMNWEKPAPGVQAKSNIIKFVEDGKGLVLVHFACGAFQDWPEFKNLAGRIWDPEKRPHDPFGKFSVEIADSNHPITDGLSSFDTIDELYTCLEGDRNIDVLATARSKVDSEEYPMVFAFDYGKGRVFHSPLGHDVNAISNPAVAELFRRGCAWAAGIEPVPVKKVILIGGPNSHGPGEHAHKEGVLLLKKVLESSPDCKGIETQVVLNGWPEDANILDAADSILIFSDGWETHPLAEQKNLEKFLELMSKGKGLVCIHFAVAPAKTEEAESLFLRYLGGFYKDGYSQNPYNEPLISPAASGHPVCRGLKSFTASDEFYYKIRFKENDKRLTPILTAMLPAEQPQKEILAWAFQREDGGRSFGFTGGHYHKNWQIEPLRKAVLNAIVWTAGARVPLDGVQSVVEPIDNKEIKK